MEKEITEEDSGEPNLILDDAMVVCKEEIGEIVLAELTRTRS